MYENARKGKELDFKAKNGAYKRDRDSTNSNAVYWSFLNTLQQRTHIRSLA